MPLGEHNVEPFEHNRRSGIEHKSEGVESPLEELSVGAHPEVQRSIALSLVEGELDVDRIEGRDPYLQSSQHRSRFSAAITGDPKVADGWNQVTLGLVIGDSACSGSLCAGQDQRKQPVSHLDRVAEVASLETGRGRPLPDRLEVALCEPVNGHPIDSRQNFLGAVLTPPCNPTGRRPPPDNAPQNHELAGQPAPLSGPLPSAR